MEEKHTHTHTENYHVIDKVNASDSRNDRKKFRKGLYWGKFYYQINAVWKCKIMHIKIGDHALKKRKEKKERGNYNRREYGNSIVVKIILKVILNFVRSSNHN